MTTKPRSCRWAPRAAGFTLIELVILIVVLGIMAAVITFDASPSELSIPSQAETLASNLRHLQATANSGKRTRLTVTPGTPGIYSGEVCGDADCSSPSPVFGTITLDKGVSLSGSLTPLYFDTLGRPSSSLSGTTAVSASYVVGGQKTVAIAAETGFVSVTP